MSLLEFLLYCKDKDCHGCIFECETGCEKIINAEAIFYECSNVADLLVSLEKEV